MAHTSLIICSLGLFLALCCESRLLERVSSQQAEIANSITTTKPSLDDDAGMSRWLMHDTTWGTLATTDKNQWPVSGVVAHADGPSGRLFFYLTPMDELVANIKVEPHVSFTASEESMLPMGCGGKDPEDPQCVRAAVLGTMRVVEDEAEVAIAQSTMFGRHPDMAFWPTDHGFSFFELHVRTIHLLDNYGGMKIISASEYYKSSWSGLAVK